MDVDWYEIDDPCPPKQIRVGKKCFTEEELLIKKSKYLARKRVIITDIPLDRTDREKRNKALKILDKKIDIINTHLQNLGFEKRAYDVQDRQSKNPRQSQSGWSSWIPWKKGGGMYGQYGGQYGGHEGWDEDEIYLGYDSEKPYSIYDTDGDQTMYQEPYTGGGMDCKRSRSNCLECLDEWWYGLKDEIYEQIDRVEERLEDHGVFDIIDKILVDELDLTASIEINDEIRKKIRSALLEKIVQVNTSDQVTNEYNKRLKDCDNLPETIPALQTKKTTRTIRRGKR